MSSQHQLLSVGVRPRRCHQRWTGETFRGWGVSRRKRKRAPPEVRAVPFPAQLRALTVDNLEHFFSKGKVRRGMLYHRQRLHLPGAVGGNARLATWRVCVVAALVKRSWDTSSGSVAEPSSRYKRRRGKPTTGGKNEGTTTSLAAAAIGTTPTSTSTQSTTGIPPPTPQPTNVPSITNYDLNRNIVRLKRLFDLE